MEITGTQTIAAPPPAVWNALNDPEVLRRCLPGCESVERISPEQFRILMVAAIGPLRARFNGMLRMTEAHAPSSCVMTFEGEGGPAGFGKGSATVRLNDVGGATELAYGAEAQIGGKLAQVGSRLIDSVARKMSDDFFTAFRKQFAPAPAPAAASAATPAAPQPAARSEPASIAAPAAVAAQPAAVAATTAAPRREAYLVPAWWLAVAVALGAGSALMGAGLTH